MQHRPRKRFGQNFLQSPQVIDAIVQAFNPQPSDNVVEIGPGRGALTESLLGHLNHLTVIEIDRDLHEYLHQLPLANDRLEIIDADALTVDFRQFGSALKIVGNLPYNISTPLIIHLLHYSDVLDDMLFMLQKEVVERLAASPGNKNYGRLSVMTQYYCEVEHLFNVPPEVFYPKPKVDSAIVRLSPYKQSLYPSVNFQDLERVVGQAFSMRRKTLANNLKPLISPEKLMALDIDPKQRPEQISIAEFAQIVKYIYN